MSRRVSPSREGPGTCSDTGLMLLLRGVGTLILSAPLLCLYARAKRSVLSRRLRKSVVTGKPAQRSSNCRQSAVTLHPEATRADTSRHEPTTVSVGIWGTYRPRSRPAWSLGIARFRFESRWGRYSISARRRRSGTVRRTRPRKETKPSAFRRHVATPSRAESATESSCLLGLARNRVGRMHGAQTCPPLSAGGAPRLRPQGARFLRGRLRPWGRPRVLDVRLRALRDGGRSTAVAAGRATRPTNPSREAASWETSRRAGRRSTAT